MAVVISEPCKELVGGGQNAKYVTECTELFLGGKGINKIRGFEPFVNLESLWLNDNKLKKLNNLDVQVRLKALYAQNNQICTLKGSLQYFKFLQTLDLSNNQLRDLEKQLKVLEKFKFLKELNLKGNPICEEPDYRLLVVHRLPRLTVLDQHVVTDAERRKAAGLIGGDVATLTVAFGKRIPPYNPAWDEKVPERSVMEQEMSKEAATIRDRLRHDAYMRDRGTYLNDPHPEPPRGTSLPPNAGTLRAMSVWKEQQEQQQQPQQQQGGAEGFAAGETSGRGPGSPGTTVGRGVKGPVGGGGGGSGNPVHLPRLYGGGSGSGRPPLGMSPGRGAHGRAGQQGTAQEPDPYVPKDKLVLYSVRAGPGQEQQLAGTATLTRPPPGAILFEQEEYERFLQQKAAGTAGNWQSDKVVVRL